MQKQQTKTALAKFAEKHAMNVNQALGNDPIEFVSLNMNEELIPENFRPDVSECWLNQCVSFPQNFQGKVRKCLYMPQLQTIRPTDNIPAVPIYETKLPDGDYVSANGAFFVTKGAAFPCIGKLDDLRKIVNGDSVCYLIYKNNKIIMKHEDPDTLIASYSAYLAAQNQ